MGATAATESPLYDSLPGGYDEVLAEEVPNLLGQVPLEVLDFVVDSRGQNWCPIPPTAENR